MKNIYLLLAVLFCLQQANAQSVLRGTVYSQDKQPLAGATVKIKNGSSAITAADGSFSVQTGTAPVCIISHIGYQTVEIKITNTNQQLQVILQPAAVALTEVIVSNGYQQTGKERATGSFSHIDNRLYNEQVSTNVLDRLEAVANSLSVDRKTNGGGIMIRGLSTISAPRSPLVIVDNFPYAGDINNINPNDVESITILKDAGAASIWGAKAGNGVIVITTKKGKYNQPVSVSITSNITIADAPGLFYLKQISTGDFIDVEQFLFSKGYKFSDTALSSHIAFSPVYEILFKQRNGQLSALDAAAQINALRNNDVRNDFEKYFYQKAVNQQYAFNIHGGSADLAWLLSAGLDKNINSLDASYNKINLRFENSIKASKNLQFTAGIYFTQSKTATGKPSYGSVTARTGNLFPYAQFADANGNPLPIIKDYRQTYIDTTGVGKLLNWKYYPLEDYKHVNNTTTLYDITAHAGLAYKIFSFLDLDIKYRFEKQQSDNSNLQDADAYFARDVINRFSQLNRATGVVTYKVPKGGVLDLNEAQVTANNLRGQMNFNKAFKNNSIIAIAGAEVSETKNNSNGYRTYGYNGDILTSANVDLANTYPSWVTGSNAFIPNNSSFNQKNNRFVSLYTNIAYTFKNKYTVTASGRKDASNLFGVNANDKWNPLWSVGGGWNISSEKFYKISFLPYLRLRSTYGYSGNIDPSMSAVTTIGYLSTSPYTLSPYAEVRNFYNPGLRWEKTAMLNVALDFKTRNSRISGSVEWYHKKSTDLLGSYPQDYTAGLSVNVITKNVGSMLGNGVDIEISTINIDKKIKWTSVFNGSFYKDKVVKYYLPSKQGSTFINYGEAYSGVEGKPVYAVFSYKWAGLDPLTGDPQGYVNGAVSKDYTALTGSNTLVSDMVYNGPLFPTAFGSVGNTVSWKHLSITARIIYKLGYYFRRPSIDYSNLFGSWTGHADYALRWQKPGDEQFTNVPSLVYPNISARDAFYIGSETLIDKGDNIRLQYINVSYEIGRSQFKKLPFRQARLFVVINNLGLLWKANKDGIDPDYKGSSIPPSKSIAVGFTADL